MAGLQEGAGLGRDSGPRHGVLYAQDDSARAIVACAPALGASATRRAVIWTQRRQGRQAQARQGARYTGDCATVASAAIRPRRDSRLGHARPKPQALRYCSAHRGGPACKTCMPIAWHAKPTLHGSTWSEGITRARAPHSPPGDASACSAWCAAVRAPRSALHAAPRGVVFHGMGSRYPPTSVRLLTPAGTT